MSTVSSEKCPHCGGIIKRYRNPTPTVDAIIEIDEGSVVLVRRRNEPLGWALPGGFVDYGETLEQAVKREAFEETSLAITAIRQMHTYSDPRRDPRQHTISTVFTARASGTPKAGDDAADVGVFTKDSLPDPIVFDHAAILEDYFTGRYAGNS